VRRNRLLDPDVLVVAQRLEGERKMRVDGRGDRDRIDRRIGQDVAVVGRCGDRRIPCLYLRALIRACITDGRDPAAADLAEVAHQVWSPVSVSDDAYPDHQSAPT